MYSLRRHFLAAIAITLLSVWPPAQADERLRIFLEKTQALIDAGKRIVVDGANSPFLPYLARPFEDGLDAETRARFDAANAAGDCRTVEKLRSTGFFGLYPDLLPAFEVRSRNAKPRSILRAVKLNNALRDYAAPATTYCYNRFGAKSRVSRPQIRYGRAKSAVALSPPARLGICKWSHRTSNPRHPNVR